jgi:hypothetical protein
MEGVCIIKDWVHDVVGEMHCKKLYHHFILEFLWVFTDLWLCGLVNQGSNAQRSTFYASNNITTNFTSF